MLTVLDKVANQNHLQLAKAMIPYLPPQNQRTCSVLIKICELQNVLSFYGQDHYCVSACETTDGQPEFLDIMADLRNYCDEEEQPVIDHLIQTLSTFALCLSFMQASSDEDAAPDEMPV